MRSISFVASVRWLRSRSSRSRSRTSLSRMSRSRSSISREFGTVSPNRLGSGSVGDVDAHIPHISSALPVHRSHRRIDPDLRIPQWHDRRRNHPDSDGLGHWMADAADGPSACSRRRRCRSPRLQPSQRLGARRRLAAHIDRQPRADCRCPVQTRT